MNRKQRIVAWAFIIGTVAGLMSDVIAGYITPAFEGRRWLAVGVFISSSLVGLWLALRQREEEQPRTTQLPTLRTSPEQQPSEHLAIQSTITPSPYTVGHPVDPANFFGRREEVGRVFGVIGGQQVQSVSLLGLRRSGKTSFLRYVAHPPVMARYLSDPSDYLLVFVDLQSGVTTPVDFYQKVSEALAAAVGISSPLDRFDQPQLRHVEAVLEAAAPRRVLILLDEFDRLTTYPVFNEAFFTGLRSLVTDNQLGWVTTSYRNLYELGRQLKVPQTSPFFNIFSTSIYLGALTPSEADELIIQPALSARQPFSTDDVVWLKTLAGQVPAFLQKAAQALFEARRRDPDGPVARREAKQEFTRWAEHHFSYYWETLTEKEQDLLTQIATGDTSISFFANTLQQGDTTVDDLVSYALVAESEDRYYIGGVALANWISRQVRKASG